MCDYFHSSNRVWYNFNKFLIFKNHYKIISSYFHVFKKCKTENWQFTNMKTNKTSAVWFWSTSIYTKYRVIHTHTMNNTHTYPAELAHGLRLSCLVLLADVSVTLSFTVGSCFWNYCVSFLSTVILMCVHTYFQNGYCVFFWNLLFFTQHCSWHLSFLDTLKLVSSASTIPLF